MMFLVDGDIFTIFAPMNIINNIIDIVRDLFRSSYYTKEEALSIAGKYGLRTEVLEAMKHGLSPDEALEDWDILP